MMSSSSTSMTHNSTYVPRQRNPSSEMPVNTAGKGYKTNYYYQYAPGANFNDSATSSNNFSSSVLPTTPLPPILYGQQNVKVQDYHTNAKVNPDVKVGLDNQWTPPFRPAQSNPIPIPKSPERPYQWMYPNFIPRDDEAQMSQRWMPPSSTEHYRSKYPDSRGQDSYYMNTTALPEATNTGYYSWIGAPGEIGRQHHRVMLDMYCRDREFYPTRDSNKTFYSCSSCKRNYAWKYNLTRHMKYECGAEARFQCAHCKRCFPHKQNAIHHCVRKHKIVLDKSHLYVDNGHVLVKQQDVSN